MFAAAEEPGDNAAGFAVVTEEVGEPFIDAYSYSLGFSGGLGGAAVALSTRATMFE